MYNNSNENNDKSFDLHSVFSPLKKKSDEENTSAEKRKLFTHDQSSEDIIIEKQLMTPID